VRVGLVLIPTLLISAAFGYGGHHVARNRGRLPIQAVLVLAILALPLPGAWLTAGPRLGFFVGYGAALWGLTRSNRVLRLRTREFRQALDSGEVALFYQPIVDLESGLMVGVEALVRWKHPDGLRMPVEFLHLLSDKETARRFALWQIDEAIQDAWGWPMLRVSLNATPEYLVS
jgi:sensor c-di-GMP phosphodiesterase-like protein